MNDEPEAPKCAHQWEKKKRFIQPDNPTFDNSADWFFIYKTCTVCKEERTLELVRSIGS